MQDILSTLEPLDTAVARQLTQLNMASLLELERLALLAKFKEAGLSLAQRQKLANALACAKREGRIVSQPVPLMSAPSLHRDFAAAVVVATPEESDTSVVTQVVPSKLAPPSGIASVTVPARKQPRVFVTSDLHTDHGVNFEWLRSHLPERHPDGFDVCVCAGDISDNVDILRDTLLLLKGRFDAVVYVPGNHDLWVRKRPVNLDNAPDTRTSFDRLAEVQSICAAAAVHTKPLWLVSPGTARDVLVVPLNAWYHDSWDREVDLPTHGGLAATDDFRQGWMDFSLCKLLLLSHPFIPSFLLFVQFR